MHHLQGLPHGSGLSRALPAREMCPRLVPRHGEGITGLAGKGPAGSPDRVRVETLLPGAPSLTALISSLFLSLLSCRAGSCVYPVLKCQSSSSQVSASHGRGCTPLGNFGSPGVPGAATSAGFFFVPCSRTRDFSLNRVGCVNQTAPALMPHLLSSCIFQALFL